MPGMRSVAAVCMAAYTLPGDVDPCISSPCIALSEGVSQVDHTDFPPSGPPPCDSNHPPSSDKDTATGVQLRAVFTHSGAGSKRHCQHVHGDMQRPTDQDVHESVQPDTPDVHGTDPPCLRMHAMHAVP